MRLSTSLVLHAANLECQDRADVITRSDATVLVLADGAGGISGGAQAGDVFLRAARAAVERLRTAEDCTRLLAQIDQELTRRKDCGETTGIVTVVGGRKIFGASVGDSAAWLFANDGNGELTRGQPRKPLLGSGKVRTPRSFEWDIEEGTVVVASDGLWNYASLPAIQSRVRSRDSTALAGRLAELARLPSGSFPDDVSIITCQIALE